MKQISSLFIICLLCLSLKASFGQNSTRRWVLQVIPQKNNPSITSNKNIEPNYPFVPFAVVKLSPNYLVKKSSLPLINLGQNYYYIMEAFKTNFLRAHHFCREHGMELLRIENKNESNFIEKYLRDAKIDMVWLGGTDLAEEGKFVWLSTGKKVTYSAYDKGQPDNFEGREHCLVFVLWKGQFVWNDADCGLISNFVCQVSTCNEFCIDV